MQASTTRVRLLSKLIPHIREGESTIENLATRTGIGPHLVSELISWLTSIEVATADDIRVYFEETSRLKVALVALEIGADREEVARGLSWLDFENLSAEVLARNGYEARRNLRIGRRRLQIDVLGSRGELGVAMDCKHWHKSGGVRALGRVATLQVNRCVLLARAMPTDRYGLSAIVPAVLTLHANEINSVGRVPVVPVASLEDFLQDLPGNLEKVKVIAANPALRCLGTIPKKTAA